MPPHLELVENLGRAVAASSDQKDLLKAIKSEIIGHIEKKEQIVRHGVLDIIKQILVNADRARGKRGQPECNGAPEVRSQRQSWVQDEDVRLQAFLLLGSLANGSLVRCGTCPSTDNSQEALLSSPRSTPAKQSLTCCPHYPRNTTLQGLSLRPSKLSSQSPMPSRLSNSGLTLQQPSTHRSQFTLGIVSNVLLRSLHKSPDRRRYRLRLGLWVA